MPSGVPISEMLAFSFVLSRMTSVSYAQALRTPGVHPSQTIVNGQAEVFCPRTACTATPANTRGSVSLWRTKTTECLGCFSFGLECDSRIENMLSNHAIPLAPLTSTRDNFVPVWHCLQAVMTFEFPLAVCLAANELNWAGVRVKRKHVDD